MVLQDGDGSVERGLQRLLGVLPCGLKVPMEQGLNDPLPMPLHLGTHRPGEKGIERVLQHRLKRPLGFLLQVAARSLAEHGSQSGLEPQPQLLFGLVLEGRAHSVREEAVEHGAQLLLCLLLDEVPRLVKQRAEEPGLKPLDALRPLRRRHLHRLPRCLRQGLLSLCLLHWLLLLLLLVPAWLTCRLSLRLALVADRCYLLRDLLPHGLPEVLVELRQNRLERLR
jgi:hypothetical protein